MSLSAFSGFASGFANSYGARRDREEKDAEKARQDALLTSYGANGGGAGTGYAPTGGFGANAGPSNYAGMDGTLFGLIDKTEGGGAYDTLYGHSQNGGRFDNIDVTKMTLNDLYAFSDPSGEYGQWVKANNPKGNVATPMGRHQIVGTTLRAAATEMGLSPDTIFTPQTQDAIANHLAGKRIGGAKTPAAKRAALRAEWDGFNGVSDSALDAAIAQYEANGGMLKPRPMGVPM